ncbi:50S ribosome-binding GTPase [Anabaena minutissima FACHB-250]|nr:50S ribosome-binding GTPase [Anabaena minutissima FACHB-250]
MVSNQEIRNDMDKVQAQLKEALESMIQQFGKKLKDEERKEIQKEFEEINDLLERLKTGLIFVSLFGKTSVGKSAITNSLINDDVAEVGVEHDKTTKITAYKKEPWNIVDVPGIMGEECNEKLAIEEAKKAHGHIFAIDGEPYGDEIELFDLVHNNSPDIPKIVFVNKWDQIQNNRPKKEQETIRSRISEKMGKFVKSPEDIVYGSAMLFDPERDEMVRQKLPQLLDRLYDSAGTLGAVMNILDPAKRAADLSNDMNARIFQFRAKLARRVISIFGTVAAMTIVVPFATFFGYPALLTAMVLTVSKIMGKEVTKDNAAKIMWACLKVIGVNGTAGLVGFFVVDIASTALVPVGGAGFAVGALAALGGVGFYAYRQTVTLGEITLEYIRNDFSWAGKNEKEVLERCKHGVKEHYVKFKTV